MGDKMICPIFFNGFPCPSTEQRLIFSRKVVDKAVCNWPHFKDKYFVEICMSRCEADKKAGKGKEEHSLQDGRGIYVGESSRSIYERAKEHESDRNKNAEESHQIKHWLTSHEDLLAPPKFKFKIVRSFQDPLTRQLSEAVRIELRGEVF